MAGWPGGSPDSAPSAKAQASVIPAAGRITRRGRAEREQEEARGIHRLYTVYSLCMHMVRVRKSSGLRLPRGAYVAWPGAPGSLAMHFVDFADGVRLNVAARTDR